MKNIIKTILGITAIAVLFTIASCTRVCDLGYEGDHCVTPVRDKFAGTFNGTQTCSAATDTFSIAIIPISGDVTKIKINNIYNAGFNTIGTVLANGSITIAPQTFGTGTISGSVTNNGKINISYVVTIAGLTDANCTWVQK